MDQRMKKERIVMKSFKGKEDTRCPQDKYKCIGKKHTFSKHGDIFSNAYFVGI